MNRTKNSIKNALFAFGGALALTILQLINRKLFVHFLAEDYLGLNGLFQNIVSVLSMSEMGIGTAIIYALYKPVAENDIEKIKSLMMLYKKLYTAIGLFILIVGLVFTPFLGFFIKDMPDIPYIYLYYALYVIDSGMTYFYTYKRSLIICNQQDYISSTTTLVSNVLTRVVQLLMLVLTRNYLLYLLVQIVFTRIENIVISRIADKKYPYLLEKKVERLSEEETRGLRKNILSMLSQKIGSVIVSGTDNLIISKILGLTILGHYSNYTLLINTMNSLIGKVFNAVTASVGNLVAQKEKREVEKTFLNMLFANYWIFNLVTVCFFCLLQPFIKLWVGADFLLSDGAVWVFVTVFYINGMRRTVLTFKNATGVFWYDRYRPIAEAIMNLVISIPLTYCFGVFGTKLGTLFALVGTTFWFEGYILYKQFFGMSSVKYQLLQLKYALLTQGQCFLVGNVCEHVRRGDIKGFLLQCLICVILTNIIMILIFYRTAEFKYFAGIVSKYTGEDK
uniref:lipopolysaccharide biosynthesis protein n=1 Tax=Acetatifactor sp. TaxID=1872090 RepID=UPI0040574BED